MLNIVVAPRVHNSSSERNTRKIVKYLKNEQIEYSVYFSDSISDIKDNVKEILSLGGQEFVIVGDDVIINEVISCFKDFNKVKIGIVPTGRKDDFASYLGISSNPIQAIKDILQKNVVEVDVMLVNDMIALNNVVVGATVQIAHQMSQYKWKNFLMEKIATVKYGNNFSGIDLTLEGKGKTKKENVFDLVVANGGYLKGKSISPLSNLQDGLFNLNYTTISNKIEKRKYLKMIRNGDHIYRDETKQFWMNKLKITNPEKKIKALIDGKIYNLEELEISVLEKGLKIYKKP